MATEWPGSGYRMIHDRLRARGVMINHKRVLRLWRELALDRRSRRPRRRIVRHAVPALAPPQRANERWALDFLSDRLENGQPYRILAVIDVHTRECVTIHAARSMPSWRVVRTLDRAAAVRGLPVMITLDNGPELTSKALTDWATANTVVLRYSRPGTPTDNPFIESFNARLRAECADLWWTTSIADANEMLCAWTTRYNDERPHRSLGRLPPKSFAKTTRWTEYRVPIAMDAVPS
jgi:putative transposase